MNYSTDVKQKLLSIITKMDSYNWLFTKHPKTDFSRKKKWSFEEDMKFMLTMEGKALRDELLEYFEFEILHHQILHSISVEHRYCLKHLNFYSKNLQSLLRIMLHIMVLD